MLRTRIITGLIGLGVAIAGITVGGVFYNLIILILALLGWREFSKMVGKTGTILPVIWGYLFVFLLVVTLFLHLYTFTIVTAVIAVLALGLLYIGYGHNYNLDTVAYSLFGFFYVAGGFSALLVLRDNSFYNYLDMPFVSVNMGPLILWLLLLCTWASDTFAYFAGRSFGKRKIVPTISPNKTLEGFVGGFIGCIATGIVYAAIMNLPIQVGFIIALLVGIFAPFGDLFESKIKRTCGVKDSGLLLPGHGGVLDRFDSLLFSAPVVYIYLLQL